MSSVKRDHLVPMMVPGKNGKPVLRYVRPEASDTYNERRKRIRDQVVNQPKTNVPPGLKPYVKTAQDYRQLGRERDVLSAAVDEVKSSIRRDYEQTTVDEDWGKVKVGRPSRLFDADSAARQMDKQQFLDCSKDVYLNTVLHDRFPEVYESCSEFDEGRPIVNIYIRDDEGTAKPEGNPISVDYDSTGSLRDRVESLDRLERRLSEVEQDRADIRAQFQEDFDEGLTDMGGAVVEVTFHRNVDWDAVENELGENIEACRSRKLESAKVKSVMGKDFYEGHRVKTKAAPVSYQMY